MRRSHGPGQRLMWKSRQTLPCLKISSLQVRNGSSWRIDLTDQLGDARGLGVAGREVLTQAVAQAQRLAYVDHLRFAVAEQVDARRVGYGLEPSPDRVFEGRRHVVNRF